MSTDSGQAQFFSATLKDDLQYTPTRCFETFPLPPDFDTSPSLEAAGRAYYEFRAALMMRSDKGLTMIYNRFHDPDERSTDIVRLRELHAAMDCVVVDAYGWTDLDLRCEFLLDYEEDEDEESNKRKKPWRYRWPDDVRDEVLARLLALNHERARREQLMGTGGAGSGPSRSGRARREPKVTQSENGDLFKTSR